ncbi:unnamed protein product [Prunus armeniaca]
MLESARGSDYRKEVEVGGLHKVPMWDFVQVAVMMTRVSCVLGLAVRSFGRWLSLWKSISLWQGGRQVYLGVQSRLRLCNSTKRVGLAGAEGSPLVPQLQGPSKLQKGAFRREGVTSSCLPKGRCDVIARVPSKLRKGAFRREGVTSSCLPKGRCDVIVSCEGSFQASEGSLPKGRCDVIARSPSEGKV